MQGKCLRAHDGGTDDSSAGADGRAEGAARPHPSREHDRRSRRSNLAHRSRRRGSGTCLQGHEASHADSKVATMMFSRIRVGQILIGLGVAAIATASGMPKSSAEAVVGQTRKIELPRQGEPTAADMRDTYRRPPSIPFPKNNPYTAEKLLLGKALYFDTRLSAANVLSCASCHNPGYGWGDGQPRGVGHEMKVLGRRSPTIINAAYGLIFMWDGRAGSLEEQALGPIQADVEMNLPLHQLLARLNSIPDYKPLFEAAFPGSGISAENIAKAIRSEERRVGKECRSG